MSNNYHELTANINKQLGKFGKAMPDVMAAFSSLSKASTTDGALDKKTKELIAMALAVANHCHPCIGFHSQALVKLGATQEELMETLAMSVYMGGGPSLMYAADAIDAFEQASQES